MPSPKAEGRDTDVLTATQAQTRVVELESDLMRLEAELRDARHTIDRLERSGGSPPDRKRKASISGSTVASAMASPSANGTTPPTPVLDDLLPSYATTPVTAASPSPTPSKAALFFTGPVDSEVFARFVRRVVTLYEPTSSADAAQQRWAGKELEGLLHYVRVHNLTYPAVSDLCHESSCDEGFARTPMHADAHRYSAPPGASSSHTAALQTRPTAFRSASSSPHQRRTANHATPRRVKQHHSHHSHHSHPSHNNQQHRTASPPLVFRSSSPVSQQRTVSPPVARRVVGPAVATAISRMVPMDGPAPSYGDATRASQSPSSSPAPAAPAAAAAASGDHAAPTRTVSPQSVRRRSGTQPFPAHLGKRPSSGSYSRNSSKSLSGAPPPPQRPPPPSPRRGESKSFSAAGVPVRSRSRSTSPEKRQAERQLQQLQAQQEELEGHAPAVATLAAKARVVSVSVPELLIREDQEREKACRDRAARIRWPQTQGMPAQS